MSDHSIPQPPAEAPHWTARHGKPIVRQFQDERDQRVFFLLDCGRRMRADTGRPLVWLNVHAINIVGYPCLIAFLVTAAIVLVRVPPDFFREVQALRRQED